MYQDIRDYVKRFPVVKGGPQIVKEMHAAVEHLKEAPADSPSQNPEHVFNVLPPCADACIIGVSALTKARRKSRWAGDIVAAGVYF